MARLLQEVDSAEPRWCEVSDTVTIDDVENCITECYAEEETGRGRF